MATGVTVLLLGILGTMCWFLSAFYAWRMMFAPQRPRARPQVLRQLSRPSGAMPCHSRRTCHAGIRALAQQLATHTHPWHMSSLG